MNEKKARFFVMLLLAGGALAIAFGWWFGRTKTITLHARMPEAGGWDPLGLTTEVGQPLHLRMTSDDVMHGFAIGQSDQPPVDINPGQMTEITLTFDKPGSYTFYCTRWCGPNHWRMRGTITVTGDGGKAKETSPRPLYLRLGLDIDAAHEATFIPEEKPSVNRGTALTLDLSAYQEVDYYRAHSPEEIWLELKNDLALASLSDQQRWDAVALIWQKNTSPEALPQAQQLYTQNCAACHGETGAGDGVFSQKNYPNTAQHDTAPTGHEIIQATNFTDPAKMLSASPALLQGKLIRGGMGTGMPMWGTIFTDEQTWALVSYLYTFQFEEAQ